jgi:hypothetical protein
MRYACQVTGGENDLCTHAWFDATPEELKGRLARLKMEADKKLKRSKKGYVRLIDVGQNDFNLKCGCPADDNDVQVPLEKWQAIPAEEDAFDASIDDYALFANAEGIWWKIVSSWDEDAEKDETPVLRWDFIG